MTIVIDEESISEFQTNLKKLIKKYPHLHEDYKIAKKAIKAQPISRNAPRIAGLGDEIIFPIYKLKRFYSRDYKGKGGKSGFRIIYAYDVEKEIIYLIEIYHKNKKSNHNIERIKKYFEWDRPDSGEAQFVSKSNKS